MRGASRTRQSSVDSAGKVSQTHFGSERSPTTRDTRPKWTRHHCVRCLQVHTWTKHTGKGSKSRVDKWPARVSLGGTVLGVTAEQRGLRPLLFPSTRKMYSYFTCAVTHFFFFFLRNRYTHRGREHAPVGLVSRWEFSSGGTIAVRLNRIKALCAGPR